MILTYEDEISISAEAKQREAIAKQKEADDEERMVGHFIGDRDELYFFQAADGERNLRRLCDQLLLHGRKR